MCKNGIRVEEEYCCYHRTVNYMYSKRTRMDEQKIRGRSVHINSSRVWRSNLVSPIVLVFLSIVRYWIAHPREFLFLTICNGFIQRSGANSAKHAV